MARRVIGTAVAVVAGRVVGTVTVVARRVVRTVAVGGADVGRGSDAAGGVGGPGAQARGGRECCRRSEVGDALHGVLLAGVVIDVPTLSRTRSESPSDGGPSTIGPSPPGPEAGPAAP
jgi:hypothetical protein